MTKKKIITSTITVIAVLVITTMTGLTDAFAEEKTTYKTAEDIQSIMTFKFKDGVEVHKFPVFTMDDNYIKKSGSQGFSVEGVVGDAPHLHRALDDAFKYNANPSYQWNYQLFDVDVDFVKNGTKVKTLPYHDCYVGDYKVKTLTDAYESYMSSSSGFAIIDDIDFQCGGLNSIAKQSPFEARSSYNTMIYEQNSFKYAEDVRAFVTFEFDDGIEVIEFPVLHTKKGFGESIDNVFPEFSVEGIVQKHVLLDKAIERARSNNGLAYGVNVDFEATIDIKKGDIILRTLEYKDCRVSGDKIITQTDKEEGYTGKSGFAYVEQTDFECIGLDTNVDTFMKIQQSTMGKRSEIIKTTFPSHEYPLGTGPKAIATFSYDDGIEVIEFPIFDQGKVITKSGPRFELEGVVGDYPILYKRIDEGLSLTSTTGANNFLNLFQVDVEIVDGEKVQRSFNYVDCRVVNYEIKSQTNKEETYFKGFALTNTFTFECQGYHPNNPVYDAMFNNSPKSTEAVSSMQLRNTSDWGPGFYQQ
jgi:hypothetical protein